MHFGMKLRQGAPTPLPTYAAWTFAGSPVPWGEFPFIWVRWDDSIDCPVYPVLPWNESDPYYLGVWVERRATCWYFGIPLEELHRGYPDVEDIYWDYEDTYFELVEPWWELDDIELFCLGEPYSYFAYYVWSYDQLINYMWCISEVSLDYGASGTEPSTWGRIKSLFE
jgi:hypothetical protein